MKNKQIKGGLQQRKFFKRHDPRNFDYQKSFGAIDINSLPKEGLGRKPTLIKDQRLLDFCSAFAAAAVREDTEKVLLNPLMTWAYAAYLRGDYKSWGMDFENMRRAVCKFGFIEEKDSLFNDASRDFLAQYKNYPPELAEKAKEHKAESGFWIGYKPNFFDAIRIALYQHREKNLSVLTGCEFAFSWLQNEGGIINSYDKKEQKFGHAIKVYDWKIINNEPYLIAQLSNGMIGDNGLMYFSKNIINSPLFRFDGLMFIDEDPNKIKNEQWGILARMLDIMKKVLQLMSQQTEQKEKEMIESISDEIPPEAKEKTYSIEEVKEIIKRVSIEEKVDTQLCLDVARCESDFIWNAKRINKDKNKSTDRGAYQWNSYWHSEITDIMAYDPEISCREFCKAVKRGRLIDWKWSMKCWNKNGEYEKYL